MIKYMNTEMLDKADENNWIEVCVLALFSL